MSTMKRLIILIVLVVIILAVLVIVTKGTKPVSSPLPSVSVSQIPLTPRPESTPIDYSKFSAKASCSLKGTIRYIDATTYNNGDALFTYKGIDHPGRNIIWTVTPKDGLSIGPNIFDRYPLPDGTSLISITLPENPIAKRYTLTAAVQYGRLAPDGNIKVSVAQCSGSTTIILP